MFFGLDGLLHIGLGDGAELTGSDDNGVTPGQDLTVVRAKLLRIDVDNVPAGQPYGIPSRQSIRGQSAMQRPLRKHALSRDLRLRVSRQPVPRRHGFVCAETFGLVTLAPVHERRWTKSPRAVTTAGLLVEGNACNSPPNVCSDPNLLRPVIDYPHLNGDCAVIGGFVYRGTSIPNLGGRFVFADYCSGKISAIEYYVDGNPFQEVLLPGGSSWATFSRSDATTPASSISSRTLMSSS